MQHVMRIGGGGGGDRYDLPVSDGEEEFSSI